MREYTPDDARALAELFRQSVHAVNAKDYTREQLDAWAPEEMDLQAWNQSFCEHVCVIAVYEGVIVGFGDMDRTGYLDRLYVHKAHQKQGIASAICDRLERSVKEGKITTHASLTAKGFFLRRGYRVIQEQCVIRNGCTLTNYRMEKENAFAERHAHAAAYRKP